MVFFAILKVSLYFNIFAMPDTTIRSNTEVVLIGAGIMRHSWINSERTSTRYKIEIFERLDRQPPRVQMHGIMQEQAILLCELNTPESEDGTIDPKKAISIAESLKYRDILVLVEQKRFPPEEFKKYSASSFVWGEEM
jgi:malate dehydrogenase (quinone)